MEMDTKNVNVHTMNNREDKPLDQPFIRSTGREELGGVPPADVPPPPHFIVQRKNDHLRRAVRISQSDLPYSGANTIETLIEVVDLEVNQIVFSVKHAHSGLWGRQTAVHKNILLACLLAQVLPPIEIPLESKRLFEQIDNPQHMHNYVERVMQFFKVDHLAAAISLYWWRAIGNGVVVVQNCTTGKMLFVLNQHVSIPSAVRALSQMVDRLRALPTTFLQTQSENFPSEEEATAPRDGYSPTATTVVDGETNQLSANEGGETPPHPSSQLSSEQIQEFVKEWGLQDGISPWATTLILRTEEKRKIVNIRYSVSVDPQDATTLSIQVHRNEPLSRELKAFPICMVQITPKSSSYTSVRVAYEKALFFTRKLFDFHSRTIKTVGQSNPLSASYRPSRTQASRAPLTADVSSPRTTLRVAANPLSSSQRKRTSPCSISHHSQVRTLSRGAASTRSSGAAYYQGAGSTHPPLPNSNPTAAPVQRKFMTTTSQKSLNQPKTTSSVASARRSSRGSCQTSANHFVPASGVLMA